jgi:hypothetical protein
VVGGEVARSVLLGEEQERMIVLLQKGFFSDVQIGFHVVLHELHKTPSFCEVVHSVSKEPGVFNPFLGALTTL